MRTKNQNSLAQNAIPDGEGSTALPIAFFISYVIARAEPEAISHLKGDPSRFELSVLAEIASLLAVARNDRINMR
jgi:hypothetical protein